jgi:RNA polymerase sigma-70 factor (ECF subfamily)
MFINRLSKKTDEELVRLVQQGNERALTELYSRYSKKLVRYFHRMLWKDEPKAQDFLHDLFVKLIEWPDRIDASRPFSTWVYSVAYNMCKNEYRKQNFRKAMNGNCTNGQNVEFIQRDMDQQAFQSQLENLLSQADENDRCLFIMRYELELTVSEIATILEIPEGTVKSRLFYLKKKLAGILKVFNPAIN